MNGKAILKLRSPQQNNIQNLYHENYELIYCEYSLKKSLSKNGQVNDGITGGSIIVALPMLPNSNILSWLFDSQKKYNGEITINDSYSESLDRVYFEQARPINFRLHYEPGETTNVILIMTLNVQRLIVGESEHTNNSR